MNTEYWDRLVSLIINVPEFRTDAYRALGSHELEAPSQHSFFLSKAQERCFSDPGWGMEDILEDVPESSQENFRHWMNDCSTSRKTFDTVEFLVGEILRVEKGVQTPRYVYNGQRARELADLPPPRFRGWGPFAPWSCYCA